jgi:tetratricopeptide (TPR) repeat protein
MLVTASAIPAYQQLLQQKHKLISRVVNSSTTAARIQQASLPLAQERLEFAKDQLQVASAALKTGQLKSAQEKIDQAMKFYSMASGTVADSIQKGEAQKTRFNELSVSIESFRLYVQRALLNGNDKSPLDTEHLNNLLQLASYLGEQQNYGEANDLLNEAYMLTITAVSALKGGATIVYSQDFETPEQEYRYELERYKGLIKLFRMISPDGELPPKFKWSEPTLEASTNSFKKAQQLAKNRAFPQALETISLASKQLTKVLRMLGLPIS